jgi:transcriptional regulator with XRE-family HTH domain
MATMMPDAPQVPAAQPGREQARAELADLLRSRRGRLTPADVGLPAGARRRTPGLRREEVAQLAGVSTTYYTFLEQGRDVRPSRQVLAALAHALRLSTTERAHLFQLARVAPPADEDAHAEVLAPALHAMVAQLDPYPAYVKGRRWDVLAANRSARALFTDWMARPPGDRNLLWWTFTDPEARKVFADWEHEAAATLARFRAAAARRPGDPEFAELIERLHRASPEVRAWWPRHDVLPVAGGVKRLHHPAVGDVTFQHVVLQVADRPEQTLVSFTSADVAEEVLARLASGIP